MSTNDADDDGLWDSIRALQHELASRDPQNSGRVSKSDFVTALQRCGGEFEQIDALSLQFRSSSLERDDPKDPRRSSSNDTWPVNYKSFLAHTIRLATCSDAESPLGTTTTNCNPQHLSPDLMVLTNPTSQTISLSKQREVSPAPHSTVPPSPSDFIEFATRQAVTASLPRASSRERSLSGSTSQVPTLERVLQEFSSPPQSGRESLPPKPPPSMYSMACSTVQEPHQDSSTTNGKDTSKTKGKLMTMRAIFSRIDTDQDERVSAEECAAALSQRGVNVSLVSLEVLFESAGVVGGGSADFAAFCTALSRLPADRILELREEAKWGAQSRGVDASDLHSRAVMASSANRRIDPPSYSCPPSLDTTLSAIPMNDSHTRPETCGGSSFSAAHPLFARQTQSTLAKRSQDERAKLSTKIKQVAATDIHKRPDKATGNTKITTSMESRRMRTSAAPRTTQRVFVDPTTRVAGRLSAQSPMMRDPQPTVPVVMKATRQTVEATPSRSVLQERSSNMVRSEAKNIEHRSNRSVHSVLGSERITTPVMKVKLEGNSNAAFTPKQHPSFDAAPSKPTLDTDGETKCAQLLQLCRTLDPSNSGRLTQTQVAAFLRSVNPHLCEDNVAQMLHPYCHMISTGQSDQRTMVCDYLKFVDDLLASLEALKRRSRENTTTTQDCTPSNNGNLQSSTERPLCERVAEAKQKMRQLLITELQSVSGVGLELLIVMLNNADSQGTGYLNEKDLRRIVCDLYMHSVSTLPPGWLLDRLVRVARVPFEDPQSFGHQVSEAELEARTAAKRLPRNQQLCDYRFLLTDLGVTER